MNADELRSRMDDDIVQYSDNVLDMYNAPFARMMGIEIVSLSEDEAVCEMVVFENGTVLYLNAAQTPHVFWRTEDDSLYRAVEALVTEPTE